MLRPLMHYLERRLHARDFNARVAHPFDWGLEFLGSEPQEDPRAFLRRFNAEALADSNDFFTPSPSRAAEFEFDGFYLKFPSGLVTPYEKNNLVHARFFQTPANGVNDRAVIVSPQW